MSRTRTWCHPLAPGHVDFITAAGGNSRNWLKQEFFQGFSSRSCRHDVVPRGFADPARRTSSPIRANTAPRAENASDQWSQRFTPSSVRATCIAPSNFLTVTALSPCSSAGGCRWCGRSLPSRRGWRACRWPNFRSIPSSAPGYRQDQGGMNILDPAIRRACHPALGGILAIFRRKSELHVVRRPQQLCESLDYPIETPI